LRPMMREWKRTPDSRMRKAASWCGKVWSVLQRAGSVWVVVAEGGRVVDEGLAVMGVYDGRVAERGTRWMSWSAEWKNWWEHWVWERGRKVVRLGVARATRVSLVISGSSSCSEAWPKLYLFSTYHSAPKSRRKTNMTDMRAMAVGQGNLPQPADRATQEMGPILS
jgi:hypothetical protein